MYRKQVSGRQLLLLLLSFLIALGAVLCAFRFRRQVPKASAAVAVDAAERMQLCMAAVKEEKQLRGIPIPEEDVFETGLLGEAYNFTTTTLGDLSAKRTTCDPNMAAFMVFLLEEAGLTCGDTLGCCFSGSFPGLNIAVLCACDAMGVTPVYITSCGASTWGANNPAFSFPEMAALLYARGLISAAPALVTPGGSSDMGGTADPEAFDEICDRAFALGYPILMEPELRKNVALKKALLDAASIDCFISVGGSISAAGNNGIAELIGQGIIRVPVSVVNAGSGLLEHYLSKGLPVIQLLNIRQLCADYGIPFDPPRQEPIGEGALYHETEYAGWALWAGLAGELILFGFSLCKTRFFFSREQYFPVDFRNRV